MDRKIRQVIAASRLLPPFEIVSYPKTFDVLVKTPTGSEFTVTVPITLYNNEEEFIKDSTELATAIQRGILMEKADSLRLVTDEQAKSLKLGDTKIEDLDTIDATDEFSMKMQAKTIDVVE